MFPFTVYLLLLHHLITTPSSPTVDFLFNSFKTTDLLLIDDARIDSSVIRLTNDSDQFSIGRAFYPTQLPLKNTTTTSFSTTFIFSILPRKRTSPGFGFTFLLSSTTSPAFALPGQYFGLFSNATDPPVAPLLAVEFDTGRNPEFNDIDDDHVGIDLNNIESAYAQPAGYWNSGTEFVGIDMKSGRNIQAWVEFDGVTCQINVTIVPAGAPKPQRPLIAYRNPVIANYVSDVMYVGFSASKVTHVEAQRILAWSLSNTGLARELNTSNLPLFLPESSPSSSSTALIAGISSGAAVFLLCGTLALYLLHRRRIRKKKEEDAIEDWELEYWPHRFTYEELHQATEGFAKEHLLGYGGFGKVFKGVLANSNNAEVAVKCVARDSKQGVREFIAEISSMGRMQHRSLVQMRGWCRKGTELMLVYDFMPNGSLNKWIFDRPEKLLGWEGRRRVLTDVAEGLLYLHHGWEQIVLHRDIKASNILLDANMRGKLGDFGLARLYQHGQAPSSTRIVGTLGYLAPELAHLPMPTTSSDVFSFGVVMLEVACGRRPIETWSDDEPLLIDRVRELYVAGQLLEAADARIAGEYNVEEMETLLTLGLACCHPEPEHRPTMREIVSMLLGDEAVVPLPLPSDMLSDLTRSRDHEEPAA